MRGGSIAAWLVLALGSGACGTLIVDGDQPDAGSPAGPDASAEVSASGPDAAPPLPVSDSGSLLDGGEPICGHRADGPWLLFVTSATFTGRAGVASSSGTEAFDEACTKIANNAGFGGAFKAYAATALETAAKHVGTSPTGWMRPDGKVVFSSSTLMPPQVPINVTEKCTTANDGVGAWTGVAPDGGAADDCSLWDSESTTGYYGDPGAVDSTWQAKDRSNCNVPRHLYCFQTAAN